MSDSAIEIATSLLVDVLVIGIFVYAYILIRTFVIRPKGELDELHKDLRNRFQENAPSASGVPFSAIAAFVIVALLKSVSAEKTLAFTAFGLEFEGPAAPVTLWVVCFAAFVWAIKSLAIYVIHLGQEQWLEQYFERQS